MGDFNNLFKALSSIPNGVGNGTKRGLKRGAVIVIGKAKAKLGNYQASSGNFPAWSKLKPETIRRKHLSRSGKYKGKLTKAGKNYLKTYGKWGSGGNADSPLVDTGHLRQAITMDDNLLDSDKVVFVGVCAGGKKQGKGSPGDYARAQELGYAPKGIPPRPYLRPALHESREEIKKEVSKALAEAIKGALR